jgi:hypothetical protein
LRGSRPARLWWRSYLSRTIRLSLLAANIVEAILNGTQAATLQLSDLEGLFPIDWQEQRAAFGFTMVSDT